MGPDDDEHSDTVAQRPDTISTEAPTLAAEPGPRGKRDSLTEIPTIAPPLTPGGGERYTVGELLGKGGMGEVVLATDQQIGREVAIKRLRFKPSPQGYARFLREARIQGRLEHPAIVPVHELSIDADGRPFFVMKRLSGTTLYDILDLLREGDPFTEERWPRQRLLRAFVDVCLAVEFAHTRGVIHRDLKPANIVLGDFGEVYVLDWGVARVLSDGGEGTAGADGDIDSLGETAGPAPTPQPVSPSIETGSPGAPGPTEAGTILGTPGYIPPEQINGDAALDHRADVFALGCILFEILAVEPLFPRGRPGLTAPFGEVDARPSQRPRGRDVPPELDALCVTATRPNPIGRLASARSLGDGTQAFLDGDRDLGLRKKIAAEHVAAARAALAGGDGVAERRVAMREAGRAIALDPTATDAADVVGRLMLEPPVTMPREVEDEIRMLEEGEIKAQSAAAFLGFVIYLLFLPIISWIGVRSGWDLVAMALAMGLNGSLALIIARARNRIPHWWIWTAVVGNCLLLALLARLLGPFLVVPGLAAATTMAFSFYPWMKMWLLWASITAAVLAPLALEAAGVLPATIGVHDGNLILHAPAIDMHMPQAEITLIAYVVALVGISAVLARRLAGAQRGARRTLHLQAWHLRQLMPSRRTTQG